MRTDIDDRIDAALERGKAATQERRARLEADRRILRAEYEKMQAEWDLARQQREAAGCRITGIESLIPPYRPSQRQLDIVKARQCGTSRSTAEAFEAWPTPAEVKPRLMLVTECDFPCVYKRPNILTRLWRWIARKK